MAFVKVVKTRQYFKRYQTKYRRRREAKTDYYARKRMIAQDLNKYGTHKYRLVARFTNQKIITQVVYSTLAGDRVMAQANSTELKHFGLTAGLTSYPAAYATGLLLARRVLKILDMDKLYEGNQNVDGQDYDVSATPNPERKPFTVILDIGIKRPTVGARIFGVMKGACDGGLNVPHSVKRFPGFKKGSSKRKNKYNADVHRDRIFGVHIDEYMKLLKKEGNDAYLKQFSAWDKCLKDNGCSSVEDLFTKVFENVRKTPDRQGEKKKQYKPKFLNSEKTLVQGKSQYKREVKLTNAQRKENLQKKIEMVKEQIRKLESA